MNPEVRQFQDVFCFCESNGPFLGANPEVFNSRLKNRLFYGGIGTKDLFKRTWKDLSEHISIYCDGVDLTWKVQELKLHCLLFLNIPRYAGGTLPWGTTHPSSTGGTASTMNAQQQSVGGGNQSSPSHSPQFSPPSYSDGRVEVLGFTSATLVSSGLLVGSHDMDPCVCFGI